jgi:hypothetical protein
MDRVELTKMKRNPKRKKVSFGSGVVSKISPTKDYPNVINIILTFEEGLKLGLAIDECLRQINSYNRAFKAGKLRGLNLAFKAALGRIDVMEAKLGRET